MVLLLFKETWYWQIADKVKNEMWNEMSDPIVLARKRNISMDLWTVLQKCKLFREVLWIGSCPQLMQKMNNPACAEPTFHGLRRRRKKTTMQHCPGKNKDGIDFLVQKEVDQQWTEFTEGYERRKPILF